MEPQFALEATLPHQPISMQSFRRRILYDPMPNLGQSMSISLRPRFKEAIKTVRAEAPIAHPPNERDRTIRK